MSKTPKTRKPNLGSRKSLNSAFKSPFQTSHQERKRNHSQDNEKDLLTEIESLQLKIEKIDAEIKDLQSRGYKVEELQAHIDGLHTYNEIKDIGQMVIGRVAELQGVRTFDLYQKYGLDIND